MDDSFKKVPINVPKLSGFDKSHHNLLTTKVGTITPILIDELIPGSKVDLKLALSASLPPLASETFMRCSVKVEAFFCPMRILAGSFESWFTDQEKKFAGTVSGRTYTARKGFLPVIGGFPTGDTTTLQFESAGCLADYLGYKAPVAGGLIGSYYISAMPFLAYHRVYHDWYRNTLVQNDVFLPPSGTGGSSGAATVPTPPSNVGVAGMAPYTFFSDGSSSASGTSYIIDSADRLQLADGKFLYELRQRNFGLDYFTTATPTPQQGSAEVVTFSTSGSTGQFSIAALRAANSMQQFKERNNLIGNLYVEQVYGRYGVRPSDGIAQRSLYLGRTEFEVYSKGIYQNSPEDVNQSSTNNPMSSVGARYGAGYAAGDGQVVSNFEAKEPGYLIVMATLVPRVTYSSGIHRRMTNYVGPGSLADLANPILQNVGPQPIMSRELFGDIQDATVFGYTDRYASFKTMEDELHGLVRDGSSLQAFAAQRTFPWNGSAPQMSSSFLEIPTTYLDQVTAVTAQISQYGCWMDCFFDYRVAQPLAKYSLPSLQDPAYEHGKTIVVSRGGSKL